MARAYEASIEEELTCGVCFELFIDPCIPKDLNCSHVICEICLKKMVNKNVVDCPECRMRTKVANNDVSKLRTNLRVRNLAQKHRHHTKNKVRPVHGNTSIDANKGQHCSSHPGETANFFCRTCNSIVCPRCIILNHHEKSRHHEICDINIYHQEKWNRMKVDLTKAEQFSVQCQKAAVELDKTERNILAYIAYEEDKIGKASTVAKENIDRQCEEIKFQFRGMHEPQLGECRRRKAVLQSSVTLLQRVAMEAKVAMGTKSSEFLTKIEALSQKLKDVHVKQGDETGVYHYSPGEVKFNIDPLVVSFGKVKLGDIVGTHTLTEPNSKGVAAESLRNFENTSNSRSVEQRVADNSETRLSPNKCEKVLSPRYNDVTDKNTEGLTRQVELFFAFQGLESCVQNIATNESGNVLAVSESNGNVVHVCHRQSNGEYVRKFCLNIPRDYGNGPSLVAIKQDKGFFVARDRAIHMYSASGDYLKSGLKIRCETSTADLGFICITTTPDDRIVLGEFKGASSKLSALELRTSDGNLVLSIPLDTLPLDIAAIDNHQIALISWEESYVVIFDFKAGTNRRFSLGKGFKPKSVCYDKKTESLLISGMNRKGDGVIRQYSVTSGRSIAQIEQGFKNPCAMTPAGSGVLLVGEENSVQLFKMWV